MHGVYVCLTTHIQHFTSVHTSDTVIGVSYTYNSLISLSHLSYLRNTSQIKIDINLSHQGLVFLHSVGFDY